MSLGYRRLAPDLLVLVPCLLFGSFNGGVLAIILEDKVGEDLRLVEEELDALLAGLVLLVEELLVGLVLQLERKIFLLLLELTQLLPLLLGLVVGCLLELLDGLLGKHEVGRDALLGGGGFLLFLLVSLLQDILLSLSTHIYCVCVCMYYLVGTCL